MPVFFMTRGSDNERNSGAHHEGSAHGAGAAASSCSIQPPGGSAAPAPPSSSSPPAVLDRSPYPPRISSLQSFRPDGAVANITPEGTPTQTPRRGDSGPASSPLSSALSSPLSSPAARGAPPSTPGRRRLELERSWTPGEDGTRSMSMSRSSAKASPADHSPYLSRLFTLDAQNTRDSSTHRSVATPTYRSLDTPAHRSVDTPAYRSVDTPAYRSVDTPAYRSLDPYLDQSHNSLHDADADADADAAHMPAALDVVAGYSPSPNDPYAVSSPGSMRRASPMPQAMPVTYFPSTAPWQHASNHLSSPTDTAPSTGKTSQVLAKLTAECDRLRREIKAEKAARDEAVQQMQAVKGRVNWLEDKNSTLQMQLDASENTLARKDRRLVDMKATLEEAVARRKRAEDREAEMGRKLGDTVSQAARDVSEAHTAQKASENAYTTLENEYLGLRKRIGLLKKEVDTLTQNLNQRNLFHREQVTKLEVLLGQQRNQQEKSDRQVAEMGALLRTYKETEENTKMLEEELQSTVDEMRWVMQLHNSREGGEPVAIRRQLAKLDDASVSRPSPAKAVAKANTGNKMRKSELGLVS